MTTPAEIDNISIKDIPSILPMLSDAEQSQILAELDKLEQLKFRELCQEKFIAFVKHVWPTFISGRHHLRMAEAFERVAKGELKRLIINMPPRHRMSLKTKVFSTEGWRTVENIEVGEYVFSPKGEPVKVVGKSPIFQEQLYEVETTDGHIVECDGEHLWTASFLTRGHPNFDSSFKEYTTKELYLRGKPARGGPYLPDWSAVQFPTAKLPIDPYILGVWLGDGSKYGAIIGCSYIDKDEMGVLIRGCGYSVTTNDKHQTLNVQGLHKKLRENNLLKNKHIPERYFTASEEQRIALLQGLIDTDGSVGKAGRVTFHQTDYKLVKQVCSLVNSLGVKARITSRQTKPTSLVKNSKVSYRINFRHPKAAKLSRKAERLGGFSKSGGRALTIRKTENIGRVQCLQVDNEDGLFLVGEHFIVGHNTKSEFASYILPAWFLGQYPHKKIIQCSHTAELAVGFGRKVRNLVDKEEYKDVFPGVGLQTDSKAAGRWNTNAGGDYFAIGVGGAVTGKGADVLIIDDPHSEQEAAIAESSPEVYDKTYEWYTSGPRQRLQPGGAIVIVATRWSKRDLIGRVVKDSIERGGEEWEVIEFPAELPSGNALWPEFWAIEELMTLKAELPNSKWMAQYQQNPTSEAAAIVKREWWRTWERDDPPVCSFVMTAWDTAFEKNTRADYSAQTTWGVFYHEDEGSGKTEPNIILLDAFRGKWEFPELKRRVLEYYKEEKPDSLIIEKKSSGAPLIYELRAMGVIVTEFTPTRGNDKISRLNAVSDVFASGRVWAPNTSWAEQVQDEVASFPAGMNDDYTDTVSMALARFRQGGYVGTALDEPEEEVYFKSNRAAGYY